jgi:type II secretory pathway pseudopilin PulG
MKKISTSILGVTLLEVMLVLAIAAMVIVMSVRYYQSASANQQATSMMQQIQAIVSAADGLAQAGGNYTVVTTAAITSLMPDGKMTSPWGGAITIPTSKTGNYTVRYASVPKNVCPLVRAQLVANSKYSAVTACSTTAVTTLNFTYTPGA